MDYELTQRLKAYESLFLKSFKSYIERYFQSLNTSIKEEIDSYFMEICIINHQFARSIKFSISGGVNEEGQIYHALRFHIQNNAPTKSKGERASFSIGDYAVDRGIEYKNADFFLNEKSLDIRIEQFLLNVLEIMKSEEFQKILQSEYWPDIKPDMRPYK